VTLALHGLRPVAPGRPLLLLHGRGLRSPAAVLLRVAAWPGPVFALDLAGHGASTALRGGCHSVEILMPDADAALAHLVRRAVRGVWLAAVVGEPGALVTALPDALAHDAGLAGA
jgi:pimeloyl-ACP methyl ester carboxylesterase